MSPYNPGLIPASALPLIAVVRQTRSPQTTGLESPRPGSAVFHCTFVLPATFQVLAVGRPSATPLAAIPRNWGQSTPGRGAAAPEMKIGAATARTAAEARSEWERSRRMVTSREGFVRTM